MNINFPNSRIIKNTKIYIVSNDFSYISLNLLEIFQLNLIQENLPNELKNILIKKEIAIIKDEIGWVLKFNEKFKNFYVFSKMHWISQKEFFSNPIFFKSLILILISADHRNFHLNSFFLTYFFNSALFLWSTIIFWELMWSCDLFLQSARVLKSLFLLKSKIICSGFFQFIMQKNFRFSIRNFWRFISLGLRFSKAYNCNIFFSFALLKNLFRPLSDHS